MSRVQDLVDELCPDGVKYSRLGEIATYSNTRIDSTDVDAMNFVGVDNLLSDRRGKTVADYLPNTPRLTAYQPGDVLLGNIRPYLKKIWLADHRGGCSGDVLAIRIMGTGADAVIEPEFLFIVLSSDDFVSYNVQHSKGAKMPRGDKGAIMEYRLPLPPIPVQREIARSLEPFAAIEPTLIEERDMRARQRMALARSLRGSPYGKKSGQAAESIRLSEIAVRYEHPIRVEASETYSNLGVRWYGEGVYVRSTRPGREIKATSLYRVKEGAFIFNRMFVTEGSFAVVPPEFALGVVSNEFPTFTLDESRVLPEWLLLYFRDERTLKRVAGEVTGVERGSTKSRRRWKDDQFLDFQIELPPLADQTETVRVLNTISELESLLSAEVVARRAQYSSYLGRLIDLPERAG